MDIPGPMSINHYCHTHGEHEWVMTAFRKVEQGPVESTETCVTCGAKQHFIDRNGGPIILDCADCGE